MSATQPVIRVETYRLAAGDFGGLTYRLHLRHELSANYFVMCQWQVLRNGSVIAQDVAVGVLEDPYGTGGLNLAGGNWLTLQRSGLVTGSADLTVTVVECLGDPEGAGFKLLDVKVTALADFAATGIQTTTDTSLVPWVDQSRIVPFGGYRGGGMYSSGATTNAQIQSVVARLTVSLTSTLTIKRYATSNTNVKAATMVTYLVQWGYEWTVVPFTVSGTNTGAALSGTGDYSTAAITGPVTSVVRANSWIWAAGYTDGVGPGDCALGQVATLGDGVTQLASETLVAVGGAVALTVRVFDVYVMQHAKLSSQWAFHGAAAGAATFTVGASVGAETYPSADTLYVPSTVGQRFASMYQGVATAVSGSMSEIFYAVSPTASTTISARTADGTPTVGWMGWMEVVDFTGLTLESDSLPTFRTTTYVFTGATFASTIYELFLNYDLSSNYFVMIEGSDIGSATPDPDVASVYMSEDPFGTGDLAVSASSRTIKLARASAANPWEGVVTIVECLRGAQSSGFRLVTVQSVVLAAFADTGVQTVTASLPNGVAWTNPDQVVLFAGWRGGGIQTVGAHVAGDIQSLGVAAVPSGTGTIQVQRYTNSATKAKAVNAVVYAVEWGSEWSVQRKLVSGVSGGAGVDVVGEYQTYYFDSSVVTSKAWIWAAFTAEDDETSHSFLSGVVTLGDGVSQSSSESRVSVGLWSSDAWLAAIYLLSHASLTSTWAFTASSGVASVDVSATTSARGEAYGTQGTTLVTTGHRFGLAYTAVSDTGLTNIATATLRPRHTGKTILNLTRPRTDGNFAGWSQTVDFGGVFTFLGALGVDETDNGGPQAYLILQDPHWTGSGNVADATSEGGRYAGPVDADAANLGSAIGFQEGTPTTDVELEYHLFGGGVGTSGGWAYRLATESAAADWKALNALTTLWRQRSWTSIGDPPTLNLYAQDVAYSTAYGMVVGAWIHSDGTVRIERQDANTPLSGWTSSAIGMAGQLADAGTEGGIGICELPDGGMLVMYQQVDSVSGFLNINAFVSHDGGASWSLVQRRILSRTTIGSLPSSGGQYQVRASGDWVRCLFNATTDGAGLVAAVQQTIVSPDRGGSWAAIASLTTYPWKALTGYIGSAPTAMVGLGDVSGTFLLAYLGSIGATTVQIAAASRDDDWEYITELDVDISTYATAPKVKGLCFVRDPDRLWLYIWVEGTDKSEIIARVCKDPGDPENATNWTTFGQISGFGGVLRYGPHCFRGTWAGNRIVLSGGVQDPDDAAPNDPTIPGHWFFQSGSWDTKPWDYSNLDSTDNDYLYSGHRLVEYQWAPCLGDPAGGGGDSDANTPWTRTTAGAVTFTWSPTKYRLSTADAAGVARFNLLLGTPAALDRWGGGLRGFAFHFHWKSEAIRSATTVAEDLGIRIKALDSTGIAGYDFTARISPTAITLYDNTAAAVSVTVATTDFANDAEIRLHMKGAQVGMSWRLLSSAPTGAWTTSGDFTMTSGALPNQALRIGILDAAAGAISTCEFSDIVISYRTDASQRLDIVKPTNLMGTKLNLGALLVAGGVRARWGGSAALQGDTFTGTLEYIRGTQNLGLDSPRNYWESSDLTENALVFVSDLASSAPRWMMDAILLVGTVDRTAKLQFSNTNSAAAWLGPAAEFDLDSTVAEDLTVVAIDGGAIQLEAPTGETFSPRRGSMVGLFLRFTVAGAMTGATYAVINDVADDLWWHVTDASDLATLGVTIGSKVAIFCDRFVFLGEDFNRYRYFRVVFPDVSTVTSDLGTYTGTHRLGAMVPGFWQRFTVPLEWTFHDNEQPNITALRTKGGATSMYAEGPVQRIVDGKVVGDVNEFRRSLRDMLRRFHGYAVRPAGLVLDSSNIGPDTVIYGRWSMGGPLDEAAWYRDAQGVWKTAGDTDFIFTEEV